MGYEESGIMNDSWSERAMYSEGVATTPTERSLFRIKVGNDNLLLNGGQMADLDVLVKSLVPYTINTTYTPIWLAGKAFVLTGSQLEDVINTLIDYGYQSEVGITNLDALVVTSFEISGGVEAGTMVLTGASGTTAAELLAAIEPIDGSINDFHIMDTTITTEKTDTDVLIATDVLIVTARNDVDYQKYILSYAE